MYVQAWRFLTYQFVHLNTEHIAFNTLVQLVGGLPLEMSQPGLEGTLRSAVSKHSGQIISLKGQCQRHSGQLISLKGQCQRNLWSAHPLKGTVSANTQFSSSA